MVYLYRIVRYLIFRYNVLCLKIGTKNWESISRGPSLTAHTQNTHAILHKNKTCRSCQRDYAKEADVNMDVDHKMLKPFKGY